MDKLRLLGSYLRKSPLTSTVSEPGIKISPKQFTFSVRVRDKDRPSKISTTKINEPASKLENTSTVVHNEYLNSLQLPYLARTSLRVSKYDYKRAAQFSNTLKRTLKTQDAHERIFSISSEDVAKLISSLFQVSEDNVSLVAKKRFFERECFTEIPKITEEVLSDIQEFEDYIGLLTHTKFHHKGSSLQDGIIPKLLKNLLHPSNLRIAPLKTASVFNDVIYYYGNKNNFATCRELYAQMKSEGIAPNVQTYNLMLRNLLRNSRLIKQQLPYREAIFYLERMKKENISADVITWNTCYFLLKDNISRVIFLEKMVERGVPLTYHLLYGILEEEDIPFNVIIDFLRENDIPVDTKIIKICHRSLIKRDKFQASWKLMEYARHLNFRVKDPFFLEEYLRQFSEKGRMDMCIMTVNTFKATFEVEPTLHCYDLLFKCLVRQGYSSEFSRVYQMLLINLKEHTGGHVVMNYWIAKCRAIMNSNIKTIPTHDSITRLDALAKRCIWDKRGIKWNCWLEYSEYRNVFRRLGSVPYQSNSRDQLDKHEVAKSSKKKVKYLKKLKETAIRNKQSHDAAYRNDYYSALKNDLINRGIIEEQAK